MTKDTVMLCYISLTMSCIIMVLVSACLPESPKYLHATGQYESCRKTLQYMARVNGMEEQSNLENVRFTQEVDNKPGQPNFM